jgi:hypothetical protein
LQVGIETTISRPVVNYMAYFFKRVFQLQIPSREAHFMTLKLTVLAALAILISIPAHAQDRVELFGGYSYERYNGSPSSNLNGFELSGQYKFISVLGLVADIDAHFGSPRGVDTKTLNVMFGPQISFPSRISPFFHVLGGFGHIRTGGFTDTSFATAIGGGIDMHLAPFFAWRVIQGDDVITHLFGQTQNSARISTGIIFRF